MFFGSSFSTYGFVALLKCTLAKVFENLPLRLEHLPYFVCMGLKPRTLHFSSYFPTDHHHQCTLSADVLSNINEELHRLHVFVRGAVLHANNNALSKQSSPSVLCVRM